MPSRPFYDRAVRFFTNKKRIVFLYYEKSDNRLRVVVVLHIFSIIDKRIKAGVSETFHGRHIYCQADVRL